METFVAPPVERCGVRRSCYFAAKSVTCGFFRFVIASFRGRWLACALRDPRIRAMNNRAGHPRVHKLCLRASSLVIVN